MQKYVAAYNTGISYIRYIYICIYIISYMIYIYINVWQTDGKLDSCCCWLLALCVFWFYFVLAAAAPSAAVVDGVGRPSFVPFPL